MIQPFLMIWSPFLFQIIERNGGRVTISNVFRYFFICVVGVATLLSVLASSLVSLLSDESFHTAATFVPIMAAAFVFSASQQIADAGILITKNTKFKPLIFGLGALISVLLNWVLVMHIGISGAAIATCVSFLVLALVTLAVSNHFYPLPLDYTKLVTTFGAGVSTYVAAATLSEGTTGITNAALSLSCFLIYPVVVWIAGVITASEKAEIYGVIRTILNFGKH